jgi:seryl-tRNA synthetase
MLDIKFIRENREAVKQNIANRQMQVDVDKLLDLDEQRRALVTQVEKLRAEQNKANEEISKEEDESARASKIRKMKEVKEKISASEPLLADIEKEFRSLLLQIPNMLQSDVPIGKDETENVVLREVGEKPKFNFPPKDYLEIAEKLDLIDMESGAKIAGARFGFLKRELALLEFALIQFTFKNLTSKKIIKKIADSVQKGYSDEVFIPVVPPQIINPETYIKMARLSEKDKDERYYIPKDNLYLIGSAEHTLGPLHMDEVVPEKELPIRYLGFSTCFRREAGSYGKDLKGLVRVHQFDKIEMESFSLPDDSLLEHKFFIATQEFLVQSLGIPYRLVMICTGDMGLPDARQVDIETWIPKENKYRETHTADMMTDYQARRLNTRTKRGNGKLEFVHMNDATAFAIGRTLIAIIENYQTSDGSVEIPKVLQKYAGFKKISKK